MSKLVAGAALLASALLTNNGVAAWGTNTESITYITPIYEGALANDTRTNDLAILSDMRSMLGAGGTYTKLGFSFSSWALSRDIKDASLNYTFDPTNLNYVLGLAKSLSLPILVHMNDGRWADCCTSNSASGWSDALVNYIAGQPNTVMMDSAGQSLFGVRGGRNLFSLSRHNDFYRSYKRRNVQASASVLATWAAANPDLFVGVSLDSETMLANTDTNSYGDYNPLAVQEWREWLQNTGIYGPGGDYFGWGRVPAFASIADFNAQMGTSFASWNAVTPPSTLTQGNVFSEEWHRWRITSIEHALADETNWIAQAGISRDLIYGHQTPELSFYTYADAAETATAANGAGGTTMYGRTPLAMGQYDNVLRGSGKNNWGIFEFNPLSTDSSFAYASTKQLWDDGIKVICPNAFENVTDKDQYSLFDSPRFGDTFGNSLRQFLTDYANKPRNLSPPPWNPGTVVYDLYDKFSTATKSGPDNHLNATGSSGGVALKTVYSAVGGTITYTTTLPAVSSGQRLNFWSLVGVMDGAGMGGAATFQVTINGSPILGQGVALPPTFWQWKHWRPVMVDVTAWAGTAATIVLTTTGESRYGWTQWGSPAVYASVSDSKSNNLALGAAVSVSSTEGGAQGWQASYLTDGNIEGGVNGRNGWSSAGRTSASCASEYAQVDLGAAKSVSKVVLHPRSDLSTAAGTGFPKNFVIQGSTDGSTWTTLSSQAGYSGVRAGFGQVFTFPSRSVRYVRVTGTVLGGVATSSKYYMQFSELEVYA